jgi:hypothetical protein
MVAGSTSETEIIESHRFSFLVYGAMACRASTAGAHQQYADTWPTANARTQCQHLALFGHADPLSNVRCWVNSGKHLLAASISPFDPFVWTGRALQAEFE